MPNDTARGARATTGSNCIPRPRHSAYHHQAPSTKQSPVVVAKKHRKKLTMTSEMTGKSEADASKDAVVATTSTTATTTTATATTTMTNDALSLPPLVLAALRLEKILHDHGESSNDNQSYVNPIKVVRRWLGTSSGATSNTNRQDGTQGTGITVEDIQVATKLLLNPDMECTQKGRSLLLSKDLLSFEGTPEAMMDMDTEEATTSTDTHYVTMASAREVECWLLSLMIRTLWKQQQKLSTTATTSTSQLIPAMMTFANEALLISTAHLEQHGPGTTTTTLVTSSMYPFVARLYRFAALAYESYSVAATASTTSNNISQQQQQMNDMLSTMSRAHTFATVRRDVDTQATLLNIMLRELLRHAQGTRLFCVGGLDTVWQPPRVST